jgi:hypothetical protein
MQGLLVNVNQEPGRDCAVALTVSFVIYPLPRYPVVLHVINADLD